VFERALLIFVLLTIFTYTLGVFVASSGNRSAREALVGILKVPAFYLSIIGLALNWLQIQLPAPVNSALVLLKDGTFPVMLILLGIQLRHVRINEGWRAITVSTVGRLLVAPGLAVVIGLVLGLTQVSFVAFVLQASMPVAVIATVMAGEFNLDDKQISSTVLLTTLISPFTLSLLIFYFQTAYL
jgi:malate permease and related proteins